jgi:Peroxisomal biogenesis factor 11 (PEX11)
LIFLDILARASFFGYWFYDNMLILAKLKVIKGEAAGLNKSGMLFWFFGNLFGLVLNIRQLIQISAQAAYYKKLIKDSPEKASLFKDKFSALKTAKAVAIRGLLKSGFDGITAASGAGKF